MQNNESLNKKEKKKGKKNSGIIIIIIIIKTWTFQRFVVITLLVYQLISSRDVNEDIAIVKVTN